MGVLEALFPGNWDSVNQDKTMRNFQRLNALFGLVKADSDGFGFTVAGIGVRFGSSTIVWPGASATSTAASVTHGLGGTPLAVFATPKSTAGGAYVYATILSIGATTFQIQLASQGAPAATSPTPTSWLAIG